MKNGFLRLMKSLIICLLVSVTLFGSISVSKVHENSRDSENLLEKQLGELINKYNLQGAAIALISNGKVTDYLNYGFADVNGKILVDNKTVFKIASISKTVTAYGIMKLVDEGKVNLDVPIAKYLRKWQLKDDKYDVDKVTLRALLSHTAGVSDSNEAGYKEPLPSISEALKARNIHLIREPQTKFEYSSFAGYGIVQLIIEEVTGMNFEQYMKSQVFAPLKMDTANYDNNNKAVDYQMATPYASFNKAVKTEPIIMKGAGGVNANSEDLAKFVIGLIDYYNSGNSEMFAIQPHTENVHGVYGLGIIPSEINDKTVYHHNGTFVGWNAEIAFEPKMREGIVILTNSDLGFNFTYDALGAWTQSIAHGVTNDTAAVHKMEKIIDLISILVVVLIIIVGLSLIVRVKRKSISFVRNKTQLGRPLIKAVILLILMILWNVVFYTKIPFRVLYNMDNYYLFTFFTVNFQRLSAAIISLLVLLIVRSFYIKK